MSQQLNKEDERKLIKLAQQKNYDAIVALLDYRTEQAIEKLTKTSSDHRFIQGEIKALRGFIGDIVRTAK